MASSGTAAAKERWLDRHRQLARQEALLEQGERFLWRSEVLLQSPCVVLASRARSSGRVALPSTHGEPSQPQQHADLRRSSLGAELKLDVSAALLRRQLLVKVDQMRESARALKQQVR